MTKLKQMFYAKCTNSFKYVLCGHTDSDEKFTCCSTVYKNYLPACDCKPSIVFKHFDSVSSMSGDAARVIQVKQVVNDKVNFKHQ